MPERLKQKWLDPAGLDDPSALFRHEIAFALGQMQVSVDASEYAVVLRPALAAATLL